MNKLDLITKVKALDSITQDERSYLINLINTKKKYGLVWEDKPEDVEELLRDNLPVLKEVKEKAIVKGDTNPNHILIEGDNLHALTALTFTHENRIDVIYIDPPYNTGSKEDFIYNDHYVDKEDAFRHSKWLSFMSKRLNIAKKLLSPDGVIFCSIGDDEISQLTLLFNEIFTEENKLGVIARVAKTAGDKGSYFAPSKDYVLVYAKNKTLLSDFKDAVDDTLFKKTEEEGERKGEKFRDDVALYQASLDTRPNQRYYIQCPDGSFCIPPGESFPEEKSDGAKAKPIEGDGVWRWSRDEGFVANKHLIVFKQTKKSPLLDENGNRSKWNLYTKSYLNDRSEKGASPRDYLDNFINRKGADFIKQYDIDFSYSKPFELIEHLIKITNKSNDITILDFFSGSGTTLHATLSLNSTDNGTRTCIISTNNENKICEEVTYPRCHRVINKYTNKKGIEMPHFPNNNLRYFQSEFVSREPILKNKRELTKLATELLCIKENIYSEVKSLGDYQLNSTYVRCFAKDDIYLIIIYDDETIDQIVNVIKNTVAQKETREAKFKVYVFSNGQYPYTEEFEDVLKHITLCALPDAIYKAYQNVLPKKNRQIVPELEEDVQQTDSTLFN
jgi:adenine-specific DNA-methyltransferase